MIMRTTQFLRLFMLGSLLILFGIGLGVSAQAHQTETLVEGNTAFALDLYARLSATPGNLFFSPYSISTCLAMTYAGARGNTETQMGQVLHFMQDQQKLHSSFGELQRQLAEARKQKGIQLDIANALWTQKGEPFLPAFLKIATDDYQANVNQADFGTSADAVTREINRWIAQKTENKIQDILAPRSLNVNTRLVLANAIYFKGAWASPFDKAATAPQAFHLSENDQADAPLMHRFAHPGYVENGELQAVELPYSGGELSMVILLARKIGAIGQLEQQLNPAFLAGLLAQMKKQEVEIFLPKFKLNSSFQLNDPLFRMGMPDAFHWPIANLSGVDGARDLFISGVFHKAWGEINEEGTEAAAATVVTVESRAVAARPPAPPVFRADHSFIFLIRDTHSGSLLFVGRLADPRA
jgi:serine protease inhibitor